MRIKQLLKRVKTIQSICGIDISEQMILLCKKSVKDKKVGSFLVADASQGIPHKDSSFDLVFTVGVLMHNRQLQALKILKEMVRVSKKNIICFEDKHETDHAQNHDYKQLFKEAGLRIIEYSKAPEVVSAMDEVYIIGEKT